MTALGAVTVGRVYFVCRDCRDGRYAGDARLGIDGFLTAARRLVCLAGGQRSFANAEMLLRELCGWQVSDERIRHACHAEAGRIAAWRAKSRRPRFSPSARAAEFQTDATKVNTDTGWRDLKIGVFARRKAGPAGSPDDWNQRELPGPTARLAFGAIEGIGIPGPAGAWAERLESPEHPSSKWA